MKNLAIGIAMTVICAGCASLGGSSNVRELATGDHSGVDTQEVHDLHNVKDFQTWWNKAYASFSTVPALPQVDFTKDMVVAAFLGEKAHSGFTMRVVKVDETPDAYNVEINVKIPGDTCHATQMKTQPFEFVAVPDNKGKFINWNVKQSYKDCSSSRI
ncbi:MAG TPA: protease complex subunit PrcB family protein [Gammaproteobacteria bacterium]|jgi:hypothetical protein|nr:protease complex subunit PrcB family protein [Gammaproteobacteria bacterium]